MTKTERDELRALCEAATPGPWQASGYDCSVQVSGWCDFECNRVADANFVAAARTALPQLLDEIEQLNAELASAEEQNFNLSALVLR